jgi:hypothetical protein
MPGHQDFSSDCQLPGSRGTPGKPREGIKKEEQGHYSIPAIRSQVDLDNNKNS